MNNVHEDAPVVFETRWAMSYLRGPLTRNRDQAAHGAATGPPPRQRPPPAAARADAPAARPAVPAGAGPRAASAPVSPPAVPQYFLPLRGTAAAATSIGPRSLGATAIRFVDAKVGLEVTQDVLFLTAMVDEAIPVDWSRARSWAWSPATSRAAPGARRLGALPATASTAKSYERLAAGAVGAGSTAAAGWSLCGCPGRRCSRGPTNRSATSGSACRRRPASSGIG